MASFHCTGTLPKEKDLLNRRARGLDDSSEQTLRKRAGMLSAPVALVTSRFCRIHFTSLAVVLMLNNKFGLKTSIEIFFGKLRQKDCKKKLINLTAWFCLVCTFCIQVL